jgi:hypothetical protein
MVIKTAIEHDWAIDFTAWSEDLFVKFKKIGRTPIGLRMDTKVTPNFMTSLSSDIAIIGANIT